MSSSGLATVELAEEGSELAGKWVPEAGMICCSLRHRGEELLAQNRGLSSYVELGKTMGIPLLYPWANRLAGFDYSLAGRTVELPHDPSLVALDGNGLPIHGVIGGRVAWELTRPPEPGASSLSARLRWSESAPELFEVFPFEHELHYAAQLRAGTLEVEVTVHACGADVVPLAFGFHPYLALPGVQRERMLIELPAMRALTLAANQIPNGHGQQLPPQGFALGDREFDDGFDLVPERAVFSATGAGRRIELELLEGYPCAQVFAPAASSFICFEPMTAPANALCAGSGLRVLEPGERYRARFSLSIRDFP